MTMSYSETIETRGDFRVRIVIDEDADKPYDDGGSPIIRIDRRREQAEQVTDVTSYEVADGLVAAARRWSHEPDLFERYARIFHGVTAIKWYDPHDGDYTYVTCDPAHWRAAMGLTDEYMAAHPDVDFNLTGGLTEWRAWCEGEVYGYVVEHLEHYTSDTEPTRRLNRWEDIDSLFGLYGHEYAEQAAREALDEHNPTERNAST
jgi:hypothetical protein